MTFYISDYDYLDVAKIIVLIILILLLFIAINRSNSNNLLKEKRKEYIDKGYEETMVMIDKYGEIKEILIKKDSRIADMLKKN